MWWDRAITGFALRKRPENVVVWFGNLYPEEAEKTEKHCFLVFSAPPNQAPGEAFMVASEGKFLSQSYNIVTYMACNYINKYVSIIWKFIFDVETVDFESKTVQFGAIFWGIQVNWSGNGPIIFARALRKIFRSCTRCFSGWVLKSAPHHFLLFSARQIQESSYLFPCSSATRFPVHFRLCGKFPGVFWYFFAQKTRFPLFSGPFWSPLPRPGTSLIWLWNNIVGLTTSVF